MRWFWQAKPNLGTVRAFDLKLPIVALHLKNGGLHIVAQIRVDKALTCQGGGIYQVLDPDGDLVAYGHIHPDFRAVNLRFGDSLVMPVTLDFNPKLVTPPNRVGDTTGTQG